MKPRYVVIDKNKRDEFEKDWQLPYGYGGCRIFLNLGDAIDECIKRGIGYVVEKHEDGRKEELFT